MRGLFARIRKGSSHHPWATPSRANFGPDARCTGFQPPPPKKIDGD